MAEVGRPTKMTPEVIGKLEEIFALDGTVKEACFYAGINPDTYYTFVKENPKYSERFDLLRETPVLAARRTIVNSLKNPDNAFKYMERKRKNEWSLRIENTGADGKDLIPTPILGDMKVPTNVIQTYNRNEQDSPAIETDQGSTGRDISIENYFDTPALDTGSPDRQ